MTQGGSNHAHVQAMTNVEYLRAYPFKLGGSRTWARSDFLRVAGKDWKLLDEGYVTQHECR